jgi:hypothetical protein
VDLRSSISRALAEGLPLRGPLPEVDGISSGAMTLAGQADITDVVLIGGSTRIPRVGRSSRELFDGKEFCARLSVMPLGPPPTVIAAIYIKHPSASSWSYLPGLKSALFSTRVWL